MVQMVVNDVRGKKSNKFYKDTPPSHIQTQSHIPTNACTLTRTQNDEREWSAQRFSLSPGLLECGGESPGVDNFKVK